MVSVVDAQAAGEGGCPFVRSFRLILYRHYVRYM